MREIDKILDDNEKVHWEGKPMFWPFFIGSLSACVFGTFFLVFGAFPIVTAVETGFWPLLFLPHFWIGVFLVFGVPIYTALVYKYIYYVITDKRVIFQKGLIGRDFEMVDFDKITNADVNVDLLDILFGRRSGSIKIATAGSFTYTRRGAVSKPYAIRHVKDPYNVFKFFKKISHDVKTDIEYPNKLRPRTNPGYKTQYKSKK